MISTQIQFQDMHQISPRFGQALKLYKVFAENKSLLPNLSIAIFSSYLHVINSKCVSLNHARVQV